MKNVLLILLSLLVSFQVAAHCGSCGEGGSADDHAQGEDKEHHDKDARYQEAKEREAALTEEAPEGDASDSDDE